MSWTYPLYVGFFESDGERPCFKRNLDSGIFEVICSKVLIQNDINSLVQQFHLDLSDASMRWSTSGFLEFDGYHLTGADAKLIGFLIEAYGCQLVEYLRHSFANFSDVKNRLDFMLAE